MDKQDKYEKFIQNDGNDLEMANLNENSGLYQKKKPLNKKSSNQSLVDKNN